MKLPHPTLRLPKVTVPKATTPVAMSKGAKFTNAAAMFKAPKLPKMPTPKPIRAKQTPLPSPTPKMTRMPWLGNKTGTPRTPGASKQHRAEQLGDSGYPGIKF